MARLGRRLTIGGSGVALSDDSSLSQTGARGEVRRYTPPTEQEQAAAAGMIKRKENEPDTGPIIILPAIQDTSGSVGAGDSGQGGSTGGSPGSAEGGAPGSGAASGESGGMSGGGAESGAGGAGTGGESDAGGSADFKKGGFVGKAGGRVEAGEFVFTKEETKKYARILRALKTGNVTIRNQPHTPSYKGRRLA